MMKIALLIRYLVICEICMLLYMRLNSVRMWCKTHVLPLKSQHVTLSYYIFKNKYNHTQSILIFIFKSTQIKMLTRLYQIRTLYIYIYIYILKILFHLSKSGTQIKYCDYMIKEGLSWLHYFQTMWVASQHHDSKDY